MRMNYELTCKPT